MLHGPPETEDLTDGTSSLGEYCLRNLRNCGNETVIIDALTGIETNASEFLNQSIQVAKCLAHQGFGPGDRIAFCSENRIECCTLIFGTLFIGATCNPISSFFTEVEIDHSVNLSKPKIIFASPETIGKILNVAEKNDFIRNIFVFGTNNKKTQRYVNFEDTIQSYNNHLANKDNDTFHCEPQNIKENVALILGSSGTSGPSKGAQLTQWNLFSTIRMLPANDRLIPGPLSYMSGFFSFFSNVSHGKKCFLVNQFDPEFYFHCIKKFKCPAVFLNQSMMNFLAKNPEASGCDLRSLKILIYGGAALSRSNYVEIKKRYPHIAIVQIYGSTEAGYITMQEVNTSPPESVGKLTKGVTAKVVDHLSGSTVGAYTYGEVRVKSNRVLKGYIGNAEATKNAFDEDGFFCTGDIGYYNDKGEWFIVDRIKELIKYCGMQVYPNEIEAVLVSHPAVQETCVIGFPDEMAGELPLAFVVKKSYVTEKELIDFVASKLSSPQYLRGGVIFIPEMPQLRSGSGKLFRRYLKELAVSTKFSK